MGSKSLAIPRAEPICVWHEETHPLRGCQTGLRSITRYTIQHFGLEQARRLRSRFEELMASLAEFPLMGQTKEDLDPPGHDFRYVTLMKVFIVVYEPTEESIRVARILHGARNLAAELDRNAGERD